MLRIAHADLELLAIPVVDETVAELDAEVDAEVEVVAMSKRLETSHVWPST